MERKLVYFEDFNENGLPSTERWKYDVGNHGWGNNEDQYYTENRLENARVEDGKLIITAMKEDYEGSKFTSARLLSKDSWLYGRFEINAKLPSGRGTWPAIWMLPVDWSYGGWPESGEIDIMEHVGHNHGVVHGSTHSLKYNWPNNTQKTATINVENVDTEFHTYALEWTPGKIEVFVDQVSYFVSTFDPEKDTEDGWKAWPFDKPFHLILNIAVGGFWGGAEGIDESIFPQTMEIDWIKVYSL
jgi:beta-glucanase (GH16 family)